MSVGSLETLKLWVEGSDDCHTIVHLLIRNHVVPEKMSPRLEIKVAGGDQGVLGAMETTGKSNTRSPVGFVLDADDSRHDRWQAVCARLSPLGLNLPANPPPGGFVGESEGGVYRVGVWIMPDNVTDAGTLEDLVRTLVPGNDTLFSLARSSTGQAIEQGAKLTGRNIPKAELHCWLAWQERPGRPFGDAIKHHYFSHDSLAALAFVGWFKLLYKEALEPETATGG